FRNCSLEEAGQQALHCLVRRDLALIVPANAIGQDEQPAVTARFLRRRGRDVAGVIFVMAAYFSSIGKLRELHIQHRSCNTSLPAPTPLANLYISMAEVP